MRVNAVRQGGMDTRTSRDHGRRDAEWIDCHFHLNTNGLDEAQAVEMLPHVIEAIGASAVSISCVAFPLLRGFGPQQLPLALRLKARFPDRVYVFGALDYSEPDAREGRADFAAQARRLHDLGVDGFKMIEGKPTSRRVVKLPLDAPAYDPFYAFLVERSLPLLAHVADPAVCWDADNAPEHVRGAGYFYANKALPTHETFQAEALSVARRHPRLKLTQFHHRCPSNWMYGCSFAAPVEAMLLINGQPAKASVPISKRPECSVSAARFGQ